mmetsp:Transcript_15288/g.23551  ORF Transcript_15288/g.23551 Transcript_15288/m.23551 type:complete len:116 (+) Transcript_15288:211-558(+)
MEKANEGKSDQVTFVCSLMRIKYKTEKEDKKKHVNLELHNWVEEEHCVHPEWCSFDVELDDGDYFKIYCGFAKFIAMGGWILILAFVILIIITLCMTIGVRRWKSKREQGPTDVG